MKKLLPVIALVIVVGIAVLVMVPFGNEVKNSLDQKTPETSQTSESSSASKTNSDIEQSIVDYYANIEKFMSTPTADKDKLVKLLEEHLAEDYIHYDVSSPKADLAEIEPDSEPKGKDLTIFEIQEDTKTFAKTSMNVELLKIEPSGNEAIVTLTSNYQTTESESGLTTSHRMYCIDKFRMNENGNAEMYYCICKPNNETGE